MSLSVYDYGLFMGTILGVDWRRLRVGANIFNSEITSAVERGLEAGADAWTGMQGVPYRGSWGLQVVQFCHLLGGGVRMSDSDLVAVHVAIRLLILYCGPFPSVITNGEVLPPSVCTWGCHRTVGTQSNSLPGLIASAISERLKANSTRCVARNHDTNFTELHVWITPFLNGVTSPHRTFIPADGCSDRTGQVPDDVLSLIFAEAVILDDPRWTEELAGVCRRFYGLAHKLSAKTILIHDSHHSSHSPEAAVKRFSAPGHQSDRRAVRDLQWCADFLRSKELMRVMVLLLNIHTLCLKRVWLDQPIRLSSMLGVQELDLVDCTLSFAVLDCLLLAVPNVIYFRIHGEETEFTPSTTAPAESELSLLHLPQMLSVLHLDTRHVLNADQGGQWLVSMRNLQELTLDHHSEYWDINLDLYSCVALQHVSISVAITEDSNELLYLWRSLCHCNSRRLQSIHLHLHLLSGHREFKVSPDIVQGLRDMDTLIMRRLGGKAGAEDGSGGNSSITMGRFWGLGGRWGRVIG
ncbi:uncharacterized protein EV420DRAFT_1476496 [Desarmillaria tabescens]|uniref:Uncharacterized protein n=1 Tax=Armillaria tabescens TaxID=1929756 RepID=A0AA39TRA6_ARMTA|nr:uncharacterized protein EV420DRAFT_1476496 [Desarmillaria tabescens]KAK0463843.1 hypothetical protein EV420DRAFT_1476496 [Desarmillaria tabescens]